MSSTLFKITHQELQAKVMPLNGEYTFNIASSGGNMTPTRADEILNIAEDLALMRLSSRYRKLLREVDGEILVRTAQGGETTLRCSLFPLVTGTLKLWKNYPCSKKGWKVRADADAMTTGFSVALDTGVVTLDTALSAGETVWATYQHEAAQRILGVRDCVLSIAAAELARQFTFFRSADGFDRFESWESNAFQNLDKLEGIDLLDRAVLVEETESEGFYARILDL